MPGLFLKKTTLQGFGTLGGFKFENITLPVHGFEGAGRFVMGLPGEAKVLGPPAFIRYLKERVKRSSLHPGAPLKKRMT